jgi:signal transduction histidine kinase
LFFSFLLPVILILYFYIKYHNKKTKGQTDEFENLPEFVVLHKKDGEIIKINRNLSEIASQKQTNLFQLFKESNQISNIFKTKNIETNTEIGVFKLKVDNDYIAVKIISTKTEEYILSLLINLNEIRMFENKLFSTHKYEIIGTLASGLSHDFKNILQSLKLLNEINKTTDDIDNVKKNCDSIEQILNNAFDYTMNFLKLSKNSDDDYVIVDVGDFLKENIILIERTLPKNISISLYNSIGQANIRIVKSRFAQSIINLCLNAQDAIGNKENGEISILIEKHHMKLQNYIKISVTDNGKGMEDEQINKIFKTFYTTKGEKGTGLGLSMVRIAIRDFGGFITVDSEVGKGSVFNLFLPEYV